MMPKHWIQTIDVLKLVDSEWIRKEEIVLDSDDKPEAQIDLEQLDK